MNQQQIVNTQPACPHCNIQPALVAKQTRRCTNCGKRLDRGEVIQQQRVPAQRTFAFSA